MLKIKCNKNKLNNWKFLRQRKINLNKIENKNVAKPLKDI